MKRSDFTLAANGRVISVSQGYLAYVPKPLPPDITWSHGLMDMLSKADRSLVRLGQVGSTFPVPHVVARPFLRKEAVLSSQIEGTRTTFEGLLNFEAGQLSMFTDLDDAREVHNYVLALDYALERMQTLPISIRLLREVHGVLMKGVRGEMMTPGELRRSQNWIGRPGATLNEAQYVPPPVTEMHDCLNVLERYIHGDSALPPLVRVGMIHYQFEAIHPFLDGNGRIGRLLITLLLVAWNLLNQPLLYLSRYIEANRTEYYDRLLAVSQKGAWEAWLVFFLNGVYTQAEDAAQRIILLQALRQRFEQQIASFRTRERLLLMIDYLISAPITSITQAQESLDIGSYTTVQRYIEQLQALGIVKEITGKERNRVYCADEILRLIQRPIL